MQSSTINGNLRQFARQWKLGPIAYRLYYAPKGFLQKCARQGVLNMAVDACSQAQMERSANRLSAVTANETNPPLDLYFLTGKKFWYQTCFCAASLAQQTHLSVRPLIYDDGSLQPRHEAAIRRLFPNAQIILKPELDEAIEQYLPASKFPYLRDRRQFYPNIRKLTDIHAGSQGWKLVLDSDMLFFRPPTLLLDWLQNPRTPCYMVDTETSYGYPEALMQSLAQTPIIPDRVNVGISGLKSDAIDWERLEYWCKTLIQQQGTSYYLEQALIAMLVADQPCTVMPANDYIVMPHQAEVRQPQAVLHHYVADSKSWYFRYGWKHIVKGDRASEQRRQVA